MTRRTKIREHPSVGCSPQDFREASGTDPTPHLIPVPADVPAELDVRPVGDVADILAYVLDAASAHQVAA
jgi:hypothetical protein